jgi:hypothetical protein
MGVKMSNTSLPGPATSMVRLWAASHNRVCRRPSALCRTTRLEAEVESAEKAVVSLTT